MGEGTAYKAVKPIVFNVTLVNEGGSVCGVAPSRSFESTLVANFDGDDAHTLDKVVLRPDHTVEVFLGYGSEKGRALFAAVSSFKEKIQGNNAALCGFGDYDGNGKLDFSFQIYDVDNSLRTIEASVKTFYALQPVIQY